MARHLSKLARVAILVGGIGLVCLIAGTFFFSKVTIQRARESAQVLFKKQAALIAKAAEKYPSRSDNDLKSYILTLWKTQSGLPVKPYLCIFDSTAHVLLHTRRPAAVGSSVGSSPLLSSRDPLLRNLGDLARQAKSYVGEFLSADGQEQIAVFVPLKSKGWIIGIHRPKALFIREVKRALSPLLNAFLAIGLLVFPLSLLVLYYACQKLTQQNAALQDITDHTNSILSAVLNASTETIVSLDKSGRINFANKTVATRLGKDEKDIIGARLADLMPNDVATTRQSKINQVINSGKPLRFQDERNGKIFDNHVVPIRRPKDRIQGAVVFARDVTEEREKEREVRETEKYFRSLLDNMHEDILVIDRNFLITDANKRFLISTGYKREEVIGRHCFEVSHGYHESCEHHGKDCKVREVFATGKACNFVHQHLSADGSVTWHDGLLSPFFDEKGEVTHVIQAMRDVTDLMEMKTRLEESERHYRTLFNNVSDSIFIYDEKGQILEVNEVACLKLGYTTDELSNLRMSDIRAPGHPYCSAEQIGELMGQEHMIFESAHVAKDGTVIPVEVSCRLIHYRDRPAVLSVARDISERKRAEKEKEALEKELRQAQKMEAIGTLAGGIAHDFNNILAAVIGLSELALLEIEEGTTLYEHITQILKSGLRARDLVQQILAFSRQKEQERMRISIVPLIKESLKLLRSSLPKNIEIDTQIEPDPGTIEGDPTQIQQVLMNLCSNAEHAMRNTGGVLKIAVHRIEVEEGSILEDRAQLPPGSYVCLSVKDTGYGMDEKTMERIFEPYFTTKGVGEGTGLGLAVVQGIVKKHGGTITVQSKIQEGSTFNVYFPIVEGSEDRPERAERIAAPLPTGKERILFIDDEETLAEVGRGILETLGYDVTVRTSPLEALELFRAKPEYFDLVITDMSMPNMTGEQLSKELIKIRPDIPIILCTGFSHVISRKKAYEIGIKGFAMKPLLRRDLAETVRYVLDQTNNHN